MSLSDEIYSTFRLEPQNTELGIEEGLSAPLKDPLWMMGRQWQMDEFTAENGGSPMFATVHYKEEEVDKLQLSGREDKNLSSLSFLEKEVEEDSSSWNSQKLGYEFKVKGRACELSSEDYLGDGIEWYHFDLEKFQPMSPSKRILSCLVPVSYPGMPHPRWWRYESSELNLRKLSHPQINNLSMLLSEFAFIYGQDWYQAPIKYTLGSLRILETLVITDSFGISTESGVIEDNSSNDSGFEMFCMEKISSFPNVKANQLFFLPNSAWHTQKGEDLEHLTLLRDETSNSVWIIEDLITDMNNQQVNRNDVEEMEPALMSEAEQARGLPIYRQQILPPRNWIPYIQPLNRPAGMLRRAKTYLEEQAKGDIVNESKYIDQEQISRLGIHLSRNKQLARKPDDTLMVWESRSRNISPPTPQNPIQFDKVLQSKE